MTFVLVVDDERTFRDMPEQRNLVSDKATVIYARNSKDALTILQAFEVDELWLDHDLGGDDTAMPVVDYIVQHHMPFKCGIWVHSMNPVGADNIMRGLRGHYPQAHRVRVPACVQEF